jgi:hypothetical protein
MGGEIWITIGKQTKTKKYSLLPRDAPELSPQDTPENNIIAQINKFISG